VICFVIAQAPTNGCVLKSALSAPAGKDAMFSNQGTPKRPKLKAKSNTLLLARQLRVSRSRGSRTKLDQMSLSLLLTQRRKLQALAICKAQQLYGSTLKRLRLSGVAPAKTRKIVASELSAMFEQELSTQESFTDESE
jgi:hypothetical protein